MNLRVVTPPEGLPLSILEVKQQARVEDDLEESLFDAYIRAAVGMVDGPDGWLGRCLMTQTLELTADRFPPRQGWIKLPCPPLQLTGSPPAPAVTMTYVDQAGQTQTIDASVYQVIGAGGSQPARIVLGPDKEWPTPRMQKDAVTITYTAGYGDAPTDVPEPIRQALRMIVAYWMNQREAALIDPEILEVPFGYRSLLATYKVHGF